MHLHLEFYEISFVGKKMFHVNKNILMLGIYKISVVLL